MNLKPIVVINKVDKLNCRPDEVQEAVFDLMDISDSDDYSKAPDKKSDPRYYFRPWKTILARTVADGGKSHYIRGEHAKTVPALYHEILRRDGVITD